MGQEIRVRQHLDSTAYLSDNQNLFKKVYFLTFYWKDMSSTSQWRCLHLSASLARGVFGNDMWTRAEQVDVPLQEEPRPRGLCAGR